VRQRRALLESTPPRDNWIEGDEIKASAHFGRPKPPQNGNKQTLISEPEGALKSSSLLFDKVAIISIPLELFFNLLGQDEGLRCLELIAQSAFIFGADMFTVHQSLVGGQGPVVAPHPTTAFCHLLWSFVN
jgi:hypothetical protein